MTDRPTPGAGHYFASDPAVGSAERTVDLHLPDRSLRFTTDRGVFSAEQVDPGTKLLLLDGPPLDPSARTVVDLGCGYGPIAVTLAARAPGAQVWGIEVNERARALAVRNAAAAGARNVTVVAPEAVPAELVVDELWSNPPIRIGKSALHDLLTGWLARLAPQGRAVLVVQKYLGADSLARWLTVQGWSVTRLRSRQAYRLLEVRHRPHDPCTSEATP